MSKFPIAVLVLLLAGCESFPDWPAFSRSPDMASPSQYNFDWVLSGSRAVGPVQVFDNGAQMWLQFAEGAPIPAIFSRSSRGDVPLAYRREGAYVVVDRVWPMLVLRGGRLEGVVRRAAPHASGSVEQVAGEPEEAGRPSAAPASVPGTSVAASPAPAAAIPVPLAVPAPVASFEISPSDRNIRRALGRWAKTAGWTFNAEHWAVNVDVPVVGSARFDSEFKPAVLALLASTELGDRPLRPCFYSNKVVRVVPYAQVCDRTRNPAGAS